ncbi:hypothetical protein BJ742DRAFT_766464 [Cladochytrium replicatum]|nr:hypothetical protein BJ742DRAFT_766464 [Cladochytrium replicatum]
MFPKITAVFATMEMVRSAELWLHVRHAFFKAKHCADLEVFLDKLPSASQFRRLKIAVDGLTSVHETKRIARLSFDWLRLEVQQHSQPPPFIKARQLELSIAFETLGEDRQHIDFASHALVEWGGFSFQHVVPSFRVMQRQRASFQSTMTGLESLRSTHSLFLEMYREKVKPETVDAIIAVLERRRATLKNLSIAANLLRDDATEVVSDRNFASGKR